MNKKLINHMYLNLNNASQRCKEIKEKHPEYRFRIETNVLNAAVRLMVIRGKNILQVITFDEKGEKTVRDTGRE